ncbi:ATP-binding protein [Streptosporangium sandarakinum]|uniref:ATP-binding protein n=1 Tax=Streptosporangium sandarakinum TaxID=1260955 RepID=UPI0033A7B9BC
MERAARLLSRLLRVLVRRAGTANGPAGTHTTGTVNSRGAGISGTASRSGGANPTETAWPNPTGPTQPNATGPAWPKTTRAEAEAAWPPRPGRTGTDLPVISHCFPANRDQIRHARDFVAGLLGDGHPLRDDAVLLTSELATNAVEHACGPGGRLNGEAGKPGGPNGETGKPGGPNGEAGRAAGANDGPQGFLVTLTFVERGVLVTVQDPGSARIPCPRDPGLDAVGGRGLGLVNALAARWGFHRDSFGTVIWFELHSPG